MEQNLESDIITQPNNNNLHYLIDQTFRNINRLFVPSFKNGNNNSARNFFDKYYMPLVKVKNVNALIDNKSFFDQPIKNKEEAHEKLIEKSQNDDYTTETLLDYFYYQKYYKLIDIDLSRQINTSIHQKIDIVGKLEEDDGATMFVINEKQQNTIVTFSSDSLIVTE